MKIAIMQPYFFPYIGYWQLVHAVDLFVIYDDGKFIKESWMHRNRIVVSGKVNYFKIKIEEKARTRSSAKLRLLRMKFLKKSNIRRLSIHIAKPPITMMR